MSSNYYMIQGIGNIIIGIILFVLAFLAFYFSRGISQIIWKILPIFKKSLPKIIKIYALLIMIFSILAIVVSVYYYLL